VSDRTLHSASPDDTRRIGTELAKVLEAGDVLLLQGELGAGKTMLAQGIGEGLEVQEPVKSSSFVLVNQYHGRLTMYHADLYRLDDPAEVADLALEEIASDGVLVVEWPERAWHELPPEHLIVRIDEDGAESRRLTLHARGEQYNRLTEVALG
jgi:tRNA threonylcarbamoyladenosine biosynthesis protein TsaE